DPVTTTTSPVRLSSAIAAASSRSTRLEDGDRTESPVCLDRDDSAFGPRTLLGPPGAQGAYAVEIARRAPHGPAGDLHRSAASGQLTASTRPHATGSDAT